MYGVDPEVWVHVATVHFEGPTAWWLQSINHHVHDTSWKELCSWIHDRFGRYQHESLIRQLFHIKQIGTVQEYINKFSELVDQLVSYEHSSDFRYYTTHFVDGLKDDVKSVVLVQRPTDLDTAYTLSLLQDKAESARRKDFMHTDYAFKSKSMQGMSPLPLPQPPMLDKSTGGALSDKRAHEDVQIATHADNKVAALRAYRRAHGLCQYCAEKYSRGHKCAPTVQLQDVHELRGLFSVDSDSEAGVGDSDCDAQVNMLLS
jgi:hypothetical protein